MEFFKDGEIITPAPKQEIKSSKGTKEIIKNDKIKISLIHIWGTVYTVKKFLASKGITINDKWENCPEWINDYIKIEEYIDTTCRVGIFEIRAADTLQPIIDWVKSKNWELSGLEELTFNPSSILVAMRSHLKYSTHELQPLFQISEKGYKFNGNYITAVNVRGAIMRKDKFGNTVGFYRYKNKQQGTTTIRITKLENGNPSEVIENHFKDEGTSKITEEYIGFSFLPMNIKLDTTAMRSLNGATNGAYQVQMVAADGFIQIDHQNFSYDMKSIALIVYRGGGCSSSPEGYYQMYETDEANNAKLTHPLLVEIINNNVNFISVIVNSEDIGNIN